MNSRKKLLAILSYIYFIMLLLFLLATNLNCSNTQQLVNDVCEYSDKTCFTLNEFCNQFQISSICDITNQICNYAILICSTVTTDNADEVLKEMQKILSVLEYYKNTDNYYVVEAKLKEALNKYQKIYLTLKD